jgi:hypothetical protein
MNHHSQFAHGKSNSGREVRKCSSDKRRFLTSASAEAHIRENSAKLFVYQCRECGGFHFTSKPC